MTGTRTKAEDARGRGWAAWLVPAVLVLVFVVSRMAFFSAGVRFDASTLGQSWQLLDLQLLRERLLESVYYQHSQPPLYNLLVGWVLGLFHGRFAVVLHGMFALAGLGILLWAYGILRLERFGRGWAAAIALLLVLSPGAIIYENFLFYTWPVAALLACAAHALSKYGRTSLLRHAYVFLVAITSICLMRSAFHLVYLIACVGLVAWMDAAKRKQVLVAGGIAVVLVGALYAKNQLHFGFFGASSWRGMNLWRIAGPLATPQEIQGLVGQGSLPPVASVPAFSPLPAYPERYREVPPRYARLPALSQPFKANGQPNFNHHGFIEISGDYGKAASYLIRNHPGRYLKQVLRAWAIYVRPSSDYWFLARNRTAIQGYVDAVTLSGLRSRLEGVLFRGASRGKHPLSTYAVVPLALLLVSIAALFELRAGPDGRRGRTAYLFMAMTVLYVAILGNAVDIGENNRFRAMTDPLLFLATVIAVRALFRRVRGRAAGSGSRYIQETGVQRG